MLLSQGEPVKVLELLGLAGGSSSWTVPAAGALARSGGAPWPKR